MDMMELDGLAEVDALFGIAGLKEDLMDVAVLGVSAGASVVVGEMLFAKIPMLQKQNVYVQSGIAAALGIAGGIAAGRYVNRSVGAGIAAGLIGWGVAKSIQKAAGPALAGLGQVSDRDLLLGMGVVDNDIAVSDYRPLPGQTDGLSAVDNEINVSDYQPIPGTTSGLGQAGDVYTTDLRPMPGQHGANGYLQGLGSFIS